MERKGSTLFFDTNEVAYAPGLRPEMPENEARMALGIVRGGLLALLVRIDELEGAYQTRYRGELLVTRGKMSCLARTRLQLEHVLEPQMSLAELATHDSEQIQTALLENLGIDPQAEK